ncbi:MAG: PAS domain-containing protein [Alicyclobacillus herbarius]|uniref:two-component system sensor histidine kinase NtrB n=1 Tax=Alicyclobacillus herbarius TaxID=122960 RepID=UPI002355A66E|nr:ATP-binding protein [Alicyclobacillus herbarius]MCL6633038.1 PAS domain-containing protein [Alicyclobacillus herbarius]
MNDDMGRGPLWTEALSSLVDTMPVWARALNAGVLYVDEDLRVFVLNELARELLEDKVAVGTAASLSDCLPSERDSYRLLLDTAVTRETVRDRVVAWETHGKIRHVLVDTYPLQSYGDRPGGMLVMMKDLGNLTKLEQNMQKTEKLATVGKIAAGIAHEIRNPLTTVKGFLQMLGECLTAKGLQEETAYIQLIMDEIHRVNNLVTELLLLAKPRQTQKERCMIVSILKDLEPMIAADALLRGVEFTQDLGASLEGAWIWADAAMLKQLFMNLAKNALEAMESGGRLGIRAKVEGQWLRVDVSDTGPGIPYYQTDKIFDAFFTTKDKGTGLGLPICQRIVNDHGGTIRVFSKGFGATFSVFLPIQQELSESEASAPALEQGIRRPLPKSQQVSAGKGGMRIKAAQAR